MEQELEMSFDPNTIEHLGVKMYSTLPPVLAELVANAYDADAGFVKIILNDEKTNKEITIDDDGTGMTFDEINGCFLRIGRNRRKEEKIETTPKGRKVIGKKGLGKLSFFGIAQEIEIITKKGGKKNAFLMKWENIKTAADTYKPEIIKRNEDCPKDEHGTTIILREILRDTDFPVENIAESISKMFIVDSTFSISVQRNSESPIIIDNERKYAGLEREVEWTIPQDYRCETDYEKANQVTGRLIATEKPIPPKTNMRGIVLFSRNKLVNAPEYFSDSTSSHFFSYLTGQLEVNFIDDLSEDVISTNRQSLNWGHPEMQKLRDYLRDLVNWLERDWRNKREQKRKNRLSEATGINIPEWFNKLPEELRSKVAPIVQTIMRDSELPEQTNRDAIRSVHDIIPEYPYYHWRHLHPEIQKIAKEDYINNRYFEAAEKASRLYIARVKDMAEVDDPNDSTNMDHAFKMQDGKLLVTPCNSVTEKTIQNGQHFLSKGVVAGCRNPLDHSFPDYKEKLVNTGLFTEKDCLDLLSLISHLFSRLDKATKNNTNPPAA